MILGISIVGGGRRGRVPRCVDTGIVQRDDDMVWLVGANGHRCH